MTFSQFVAILRARWKLSAAVFFVTVAVAVTLSLVLPKKYLAVASVVVDVKPDPITGAILGGVMNPAIMATQVDILTSDRVARRVIRNLKLDQNAAIRAQWQDETDGQGTLEDWLTVVFQKQLDVKPSRESNVITVSYLAPDATFAAALANAFVQAYIDTNLELRVDPAKQYSGFFEQRSKEAREAVEKAQAKLSDYQQASGIIANDERLDVETARLNELSTQLVMVQALASESSNRSAQTAGNGERMSETLNSPVLVSLKVDLSRAEASLQELSARLGGNHPQVQAAKANIAELRVKVEAETRRVTGGVGINATVNAARVADLRAQLDAQRAKVLKLKEGRDAMSVLQRDVDNAQRAYDALIARLNQSSLESQTQQNNVSVLSPATPPIKHASPKLLLNTLVAIFLGGILAIGTALALEVTDRRVRGTRDLADALGLPVLGVMPKPLAGRVKPTLMSQRVIFGRLPGPKKG